jgi:hypothetical protein
VEGGGWRRVYRRRKSLPVTLCVIPGRDDREAPEAMQSSSLCVDACRPLEAASKERDKSLGFRAWDACRPRCKAADNPRFRGIVLGATLTSEVYILGWRARFRFEVLGFQGLRLIPDERGILRMSSPLLELILLDRDSSSPPFALNLPDMDRSPLFSACLAFEVRDSVADA